MYEEIYATQLLVLFITLPLCALFSLSMWRSEWPYARLREACAFVTGGLFVYCALMLSKGHVPNAVTICIAVFYIPAIAMSILAEGPHGDSAAIFLACVTIQMYFVWVLYRVLRPGLHVLFRRDDPKHAP